jgi:hypothetical protein
VIGESAFAGCAFDGTLTLPEGLERIERYAFSYCKKLTGPLEIPDSVTFIGESAFQSDTAFTALRLPAGLTLICENTFSDCGGMSGALELPAGLLVIGDRAFSGTAFTGALELPEGLRSLGKGSFSYCKSLTSVSLPDSLEHIKESAFFGCIGLLGSLTIPDGVYSVGASAFHGCIGLTSVSFGANVRSVGEGAFRECAELKNASFDGALLPDYYGPEENKPSFPEGCRVNAPAGAGTYREIWEGTVTTPAPGSGGSDGGAAREMPYFWTDGIKGDVFCGGGTYADVTLVLDGARIQLSINGRPMGETDYTADPNAYEERIVSTADFRCRDGVIRELRYLDGYNRDRQLVAQLTGDDGSVRRVVFHTGSEEALYIDVENN